MAWRDIKPASGLPHKPPHKVPTRALGEGTRRVSAGRVRWASAAPPVSAIDTHLTRSPFDKLRVAPSPPARAGGEGCFNRVPQPSLCCLRRFVRACHPWMTSCVLRLTSLRDVAQDEALCFAPSPTPLSRCARHTRNPSPLEGEVRVGGGVRAMLAPLMFVARPPSLPSPSRGEGRRAPSRQLHSIAL
jgi:hypothetical protein